jgi:hypothetical protein
MLKLRSILIIGLTFSLLLPACAPASPTSAPTFPPVSPQSTLPTATTVPTLEPIGGGVPAIQYVKGQSELSIISSLTGKPFNEFDSIPFEYFNYAFSPDRQALAVVSNAQLHLINLPSWEDHSAAISLLGPLSSVIYSPDGKLLAFAGALSSGDLWIVDAKTGESKSSTQAGFSIKNIKFTADGKGIMVYAAQLASEGIAANAGVSAGAPKAALFRTSDLHLLWSVELAGVRDGVFPKNVETANTQDIYQPGAAWQYEPGIAFAPNASILYVVHGDEDKLTTVDFIDRTVKTVDIRAKTTWFDGLLALTAGVAHAKGMDGTVKQAVISPDGKFLFVAGNTETITQQANGSNWDIKDTPTGLQMIATEDGTLIEKISIEASSVRLSPDSKQLFLANWSNGRTGTDVYDIASKSIIKHFENVYLVSTLRLDGKPILVSNRSVSPYENYITLIDPDTWGTISEWKSEGDVGWLSVP